MAVAPNNPNAVAKPRTSYARWIVFWVICAAAVLLVASIEGVINGSTLGFGAGMMAIPAAIAGYLMRKGNNVLVGFAVLVAVSGALTGQQAFRKLRATNHDIADACVNRNAAVDALPENQQATYCGCYADRLAGKLLLHVSANALMFTPVADAAIDPVIVSMATKASEECAAQLALQ